MIVLSNKQILFRNFPNFCFTSSKNSTNNSVCCLNNEWIKFHRPTTIYIQNFGGRNWFAKLVRIYVGLFTFTKFVCVFCFFFSWCYYDSILTLCCSFVVSIKIWRRENGRECWRIIYMRLFFFICDPSLFSSSFVLHIILLECCSLSSSWNGSTWEWFEHDLAAKKKLSM